MTISLNWDPYILEKPTYQIIKPGPWQNLKDQKVCWDAPKKYAFLKNCCLWPGLFIDYFDFGRQSAEFFFSTNEGGNLKKKDVQFWSIPKWESSFKPKVAIAKFIGKMQKKSGSIMKSGLDAMPIFLGKTPFGLPLPFRLTLPPWGQYFGLLLNFRLQVLQNFCLHLNFCLPPNFCLTGFWYNTELSSTGGLEEARVSKYCSVSG